MNFTKLCNLSQNSGRSASLAYKRITLMAKVSDLASFRGSVNLGFTFTREILTAYYKSNRWPPLKSSITSAIRKIIKRVTDNGKFYPRQILLIPSKCFVRGPVKVVGLLVPLMDLKMF